MRVKHLLDVRLYGPAGILPGSKAFASRYSAYGVPPTKTMFAFTEEQTLEEAMSFLDEHGLEAEHVYSFELEDDEIKGYPAFYLNFVSLFDLLVEECVDLTVMKDREAARDYDTMQFVVNKRIKKVIESVTRAVEWIPVRATDDQEWYILKVDKQLPEPILIPSAFEVDPNVSPPDTYTVRFDGRSIVTQANVEALAEFGLCLPDRMKVEGKVLSRWPIPLAASGTVMDALLSARVKGSSLRKLFPLIPESHPLSELA